MRTIFCTAPATRSARRPRQGANIDNLETRDSRRLIAGTAFSIEPGIYLEGKFGIRSEIDVYVSATDAVVTAPHQTEIIPS